MTAANLISPLDPTDVAVISWKYLAMGQKNMAEGQGEGKEPSWNIWLKAEVTEMTHHISTKLLEEN